MRNHPSNTNDVIDSRDVIERISDLQEEIERLTEEGEDHSEESAELKALEALASQGEDYAPDWKHGETLIRDDHFPRYAHDLAIECDMIPDDAKWPCTCIDWDQAARDLQHDYSAIDFDGVTYWVRS